MHLSLVAGVLANRNLKWSFGRIQRCQRGGNRLKGLRARAGFLECKLAKLRKIQSRHCLAGTAGHTGARSTNRIGFLLEFVVLQLVCAVGGDHALNR